MRNLYLLDAYRTQDSFVSESAGTFSVPSCTDRKPLTVTASSAGDWDHVSISREKRYPDWAEMEQIALLFFKDDETAMQLHAPIKDHVARNGARCLSWWRPHDGSIPDPNSRLTDRDHRRIDHAGAGGK